MGLIRESPIPSSILHATQFFEFFRAIANAATTDDEVRVSNALVQPMAAQEVAGALSRVATGSPLNGTVEVAGPEVFSMDQFIRIGLDAAGDPRTVISDPQARYFDALPGERGLLPGASATMGELRFESWLRDDVQRQQAA